MKLTTIISSVLFLGATQLVSAEAVTSVLTTTVTRTLVRVNAVTPTPTPTPSSSAVLTPTSTLGSSSTLVPTSSGSTTTSTTAPEEPEHTNMAVGLEGSMPIALAGGAVALLLGAL
ncbi:hypothetical protein BJX70DRAFT_354205 [Aspergillus crustosus]